MARLGDVQECTVTGDPEVKVSITDASITAEGIIGKYLEASGAKVKLVAVNTIKTVSEAEIQGMTITIEQLVDKTKGIAVQNTKLGSQVLYKVVEIGRAHVCTPVTNEHLVCRLLIGRKNISTAHNTQNM